MTLAQLPHMAWQGPVQADNLFHLQLHFDGAGLQSNASLAAQQAYIGTPAPPFQTKYTPLGGQDPNSIPYDKHAPLRQQVMGAIAIALGLSHPSVNGIPFVIMTVS